MSYSRELLAEAEALAKRCNTEGSCTHADVVSALRELEECWPTQRRPNVAPGGQLNPTVNGFLLGLSPDRQGGCSLSSTSQECPELTRLVTNWVKSTLPDAGFRYSSIQVNCNYAARPHVDANNLGPSYIISLGDHVGGALRTADRGVLDCYESWRLFDGSCTHSTELYSGDERFSFVLFTPNAYNTLSPALVSAVFALGFSAGSSQGMDDAYFAKFRYVILVDNGAHSVFMEKNQLDDPPRSGPGAVSVETNGAGAGKGWGWIAWQAARDLEIRHFNCCAAGIHVIALDAFVDAQTEASSANAAEPCEGPVSLRQRCVERFDLYAHTAAEAQRFFAWVALLPLGTVVAVCISSTAMAKRRPLPQCVYDAFAKLGAPETLSLIGYQNPFAFVGFKGAYRGQGAFNIDVKKQSKELLRLEVTFAVKPSLGLLADVRSTKVNLLGPLLALDSAAAPRTDARIPVPITVHDGPRPKHKKHKRTPAKIQPPPITVQPPPITVHQAPLAITVHDGPQPPPIKAVQPCAADVAPGAVAVRSGAARSKRQREASPPDVARRHLARNGYTADSAAVPGMPTAPQTYAQRLLLSTVPEAPPTVVPLLPITVHDGPQPKKQALAKKKRDDEYDADRRRRRG
mmetsp:Transcript_9396/g.32440  ORF Transcript_9396/g.32440 Transcript_9396/m.32440 type:complete len:631 (-) Transcript_9396:109-2001(-)